MSCLKIHYRNSISSPQAKLVYFVVGSWWHSLPQTCVLVQQMLVDSLPTDPMEVDPSNPSLGPPISCFAEGQQADGDAAIEAATLEEEEATAAENVRSHLTQTQGHLQRMRRP